MASTLSYLPEEVRSKYVQTHLRNVYATLTMTLGAAVAGGVFSMSYKVSTGMSFFAALADIALILWLLSTEHAAHTIKKRVAILLGIGFCSGISLGPLLTIASIVKPQIIVSALTLTAVCFGGFTAAALFAKPGTYLGIGGVCMSGLMYLSLASLINIFVRSTMLFSLELWIGLAIFCGFIIYDTQAIVVKRLAGDSDFVAHALDLFIDAIGVFRRILVILLRKEEDNDRRRKRNN